MTNWIKSMVLMTAMTLLFVWIGRMVGGQSGMILALIFAGGMNFFSYWFSDKIVLKMYHAKEVSQMEQPELYGIVQELSVAAGIPMPKLYIVPESSPNAFATGRNPRHAAVAVTEGILHILDRNELKGVLGHELAHVVHRDILIGTIVSVFAGAIMVLASIARWGAIFGGFGGSNDDDGGIFGLLIAMFIAPLAAMIIQMAISRSREYLADSGGAKFSGNPLYLASALRKLEQFSKQVPLRRATPQTAHMFIVNPFSGRRVSSLFSTHPATEDRIRRLEEMAG
ncbi:MAG: zinc metalloprotease HtpX [Acidobacteria bacterium]|nr:zinc metalloprotease HtpX [Acidobacteriota bacterium]